MRWYTFGFGLSVFEEKKKLLNHRDCDIGKGQRDHRCIYASMYTYKQIYLYIYRVGKVLQRDS